jgi:predicted acyltransferase
MAQRFIDFEYTAKALFGGALQYTGSYNTLMWAISVVAVKWLMLYVLYRKRIFLRV